MKKDLFLKQQVDTSQLSNLLTKGRVNVESDGSVKFTQKLANNVTEVCELQVTSIYLDINEE